MKTRTAELSIEQIDEYGIALLKFFGNVELTALELGISTHVLKLRISQSIELKQYCKLAVACIKERIDADIIELAFIKKDEKTKKWLMNKIYSSRAKGGYDITELGTGGAFDPLSDEILEKTRPDKKLKDKRTIIFNFVERQTLANRDDDSDDRLEEQQDFNEADYIDIEPEIPSDTQNE